MSEHTPLNISEAVAITGLPQDQLEFLLIGPRNPHLIEPISLRQALGCRLVADLIGAVIPEVATAAAATVANFGDPERNRLLIVGWSSGEARCAWHDPDVPLRAIRNPVLVMPGDRALADLGNRLIAHRVATQQPH